MNAAVRQRVRRKRQRTSSPWMGLWLVAWASLWFIALGVFGVAGAMWALYDTFADGYEPIETRLADHNAWPTEVYDRGGPQDGVYLGLISHPQAELRIPVELDEISPHVLDATVYTEDASFWDHRGVNARGLFRAVWENYVTGDLGDGTGGSSITQQLVKTVYLSDQCIMVDGREVCIAPRTVDRKLREIAYAINVDNDASKEDILSWYLNEISYADRYVGIEAAAQGYFRKSASELTLAEAALLAGIPAAPSTYHPRMNCMRDDAGECIVDEQGRIQLGGAAKQRQEYVLGQMLRHEAITRAEAEAAREATVYIYPRGQDNRSSVWIASQIEPRLIRMCEAGLLPMTPGAANCAESVQTGGYKVTTTLDWEENERARELAREKLDQGIEQGCECHNVALVTIDPRTGQIPIYLPNIDESEMKDRRIAGNIDQLMEINQPGSSFKPLIYLAWIDTLNKTPMSSLWDTSPMPLEVTDDSPEEEADISIVNPVPGGGGQGLITARTALGSSQNVPAFRAAHEAGVDTVIEYAKKMGFTTLDQRFDPTFLSHDAVTYGPSIATGGANIRPIDLAYMNATIANMGVMVGVPHLAKEVEPQHMASALSDSLQEYDEAITMHDAFARGHFRLPGSRALDPVTILKVETRDGEVLYEHGEDLERIQVVEPASVWMVHTMLEDCSARFLIWGCGFSNADGGLDMFTADGERIPMGVKTGTQQGFTSRTDVLATWMAGYSRNAATVVWVGNADKSLVRDGPAVGFASAATTRRVFKEWNGYYHDRLIELGIAVDREFDELQPENIERGSFQTVATERGMGGGCSQRRTTWLRTDIEYTGDCQDGVMPLPDYQRDMAISEARSRGIPIRTGSGSSASTSTSFGSSQ